jgi:alcohol dehydrogenase class IV
LQTRQFRIPPVLIVGSGSSEQVGEECRKLGVNKGLIVSDPVIVKLGIVDGI